MWFGSSGWSNCIDVIEGNEEIVNGFFIVGYGDGIVNEFLDFLINLNNILGGIIFLKVNNLWFEEVVKFVLNCEIRNLVVYLFILCKSNLLLLCDIEFVLVCVVVNVVYVMVYVFDDM